MFVDLLFELRRRKVPVATQEWMALMRALSLGLHESSLDGLYQLARAVLVKDVAHFDAYDAAFLEVFRGVHAESLAIVSELEEWLKDPKRLQGLTDERRRMMKELDLKELVELFRQRMAEQRERHDRGNRWVGTGGTSPFGEGGKHPTGMRVGEGGQKSALAVAAERRFAAYRNDVVLDVRRIDVALRALRELGREGAPDELDLDSTISETARNAGELEVVMQAPRRNRTKVLLLMDVGGSMDPYARLVEPLFTAASRVGRFSRFRHYYFHNCVYESVYADAWLREDLPVAALLASSDRDEKLVVVGDGAMHPAELLSPGGSYYAHSSRTPGVEWMRMLAHHFRRSVWLNPSPAWEWEQQTVRVLRSLFPMHPLTIEGLQAAVRQLLRAGAAPDPVAAD